MKQLLIGLLSACLLLSCGRKLPTATLQVETLPTYAFSDPDPVPHPDKIYPYCRYQGFETEAAPGQWNVVVLENEWLRVKIFPEIGGKIWSVYDKREEKEMFYDNDVVKFREIALRGPWTSGGIEFNYGVIGHAPSCSHPVNWCTKKLSDGSVSCFVGVLDLLTRSRWTVEINLPKDAAWVRTRSFWHNSTEQFEPYYSWYNSAVTVSEDLRLLFPGTEAIGHGGEHYAYPVDEQCNDVSLYRGQRYGGNKSYHAIGTHKSFFGAYYEDADWGVLHWALRDEKLGRKYFSWTQSREGAIWKDLLTDGRDQYIEMQSGRLFNQNREPSFGSPYKQILFQPYGTDEWTEYWFPFRGIGPADNITKDAVVSVKDGEIGLYSLQKYEGLLRILDKEGTVLYSSKISMRPTESINIKVSGSPVLVLLDGKRLWRKDEEVTSRPSSTIADFSLNSAEGMLLHALGEAGMRFYPEAETLVDRALAINPSLSGALTLKAQLCYRKTQYEEALCLADKALSINAYDPEAGYVAGLAAARVGKFFDALDRLEVCAISDSPLRGAAYLEIARLHLCDGSSELAEVYLRKALVCNTHNVTALQILYKITGKKALIREIETLDPLNPFPAAELLLSGKMAPREFALRIRQEQSWQVYLELALFYESIGRRQEAIVLLDTLDEKNILTALWIAYLRGDNAAISVAETLGVEGVFPFRGESVPVLRWALEKGGGWQTRYLLAVLMHGLGSPEPSLLMNNDADKAVYYAYRYTFSRNKADLRKAIEMEPEQWRYVHTLANDLCEEGAFIEASDLLKNYYDIHLDNFRIGDALIRALIGSGHYEEADRILETIQYLPFEGQHGTHDMYRDIKLHLAAKAIDAGRFDEARKYIAQARLWPENLGVGEPYQFDYAAENWVEMELRRREKGLTSSPVYPRLGSLLSKDSKLF